MRHLSWGVLGLVAQQGFSQATQANNNGGVGSFLGWNAGANQILEVKNEANKPIEFSTDLVQRMRLLETNTTQTIGSYTNQTVSGNLGIGLFNTTYVTMPWSLLHLDNGGNQFSGYRPWQRPGMTVTTGSDLGWIGLKDEGNDNHHLTLAWADNAASQGPDMLKFIFLANPTTLGTAGTVDGLEAARIKPNTDGLESFFGIGDWLTAGSNADPDERLDLLDRTIRLRNFMTNPPIGSGTDYESTTLENVLVVDPADGRVHWRTLTGWSGDCDWEVTATDDVVTAWQPGPINGCPDNTNNVGIGIINHRWKLHVVESSPDPTGDDKAIYAHVLGDHGMNIAVDAFSPTPSAEVNMAFRGWAQDARVNYGLFAHTTVTIPHQADANIGVYGNAQEEGTWSQGGGVANACIGVWGRARCAASNTWAGFFEGDVYASGVYTSSDESLKTNIAAVTDALDATLALEPVLFHFDTVQFDDLGLPSTLQSGLLAQNVEQAMPHLVRAVTRPAVLDTAGMEVAPAMTYKTVNYSGIIPYLIGAIHELKATNDAQQAQISTLQQDLATCCAAQGSTDERGMSPGARLRQGFGDANAGAGEALRTDLFIVPNPVADHTQLRYTVATPGRTRLEVSDAGGKRLVVLEEAVREVGAYTHDWTTTDLAPGTYHVTLFLNDSFVVKKAVKVGR